MTTLQQIQNPINWEPAVDGGMIVYWVEKDANGNWKDYSAYYKPSEWKSTLRDWGRQDLVPPPKDTVEQYSNAEEENRRMFPGIGPGMFQRRVQEPDSFLGAMGASLGGLTYTSPRHYDYAGSNQYRDTQQWWKDQNARKNITLDHDNILDSTVDYRPHNPGMSEGLELMTPLPPGLIAAFVLSAGDRQLISQAAVELGKGRAGPAFAQLAANPKLLSKFPKLAEIAKQQPDLWNNFVHNAGNKPGSAGRPVGDAFRRALYQDWDKPGTAKNPLLNRVAEVALRKGEGLPTRTVPSADRITPGRIMKPLGKVANTVRKAANLPLLATDMLQGPAYRTWGTTNPKLDRLREIQSELIRERGLGSTPDWIKKYNKNIALITEEIKKEESRSGAGFVDAILSPLPGTRRLDPDSKYHGQDFWGILGTGLGTLADETIGTKHAGEKEYGPDGVIDPRSHEKRLYDSTRNR